MHTFIRQLRFFAPLLLVISLLGCGGEGELGETCGEIGVAEGECTSGGICGQDNVTDDFTCLQICDDHPDCPTGMKCNGIEGTSTKGCRTE